MAEGWLSRTVAPQTSRLERRGGKIMGIELLDCDSGAARRAAVDTLTLAFAADPVSRWFFPEPKDYLKSFPEFTAAFAGASFGAGTAWVSDGGSGVSCWQPPGVHPDGEGIAAALFSALDEGKHAAAEKLFEKMDEFHPAEPHWYLAIVGVDSAYQGRGWGAQLMEPALSRCDEDGVIAYLESSNPANISLYQRHGFEVIGEIRVADVPVMTPMLRPAR
jgi:GNAT superfamily N-acetyltransferase